MKGRPVRRVQAGLVFVFLAGMVAIFAPKLPGGSPFQPVQHNRAELVAPTAGFDMKHLQEVLTEQADCSKAGESTKYGTSVELCPLNNSPFPPAGADISASGNYSQAIGTNPDPGLGITNAPTAPPDTGLTQGDPYSPVPHHSWWSTSTRRLLSAAMLGIGLGGLYGLGMWPFRLKNNNDTVPTAEPK